MKLLLSFCIVLVGFGSIAAQTNNRYEQLFLASVKNNDYVKAKELYQEHKININAISNAGETALYIAASSVSKQGYDFVFFLLSHGADTRIADNEGQTALMEAVWRGNIGIVQLLVQDSDVNATNNDGETALHITMQRFRENAQPFNPHSKIYDHIKGILLRNGVDPYIRNKFGTTAFKYEQYEKRLEEYRNRRKKKGICKKLLGSIPILGRL